MRFRATPPLPFREAGDQLTPNELVISIDGPYGLNSGLTGMVSGPPSHLAPLSFDKTLSEPELPGRIAGPLQRHGNVLHQRL